MMNIVIAKKTVGTIELPNRIDITDPYFNRDVWCRINDLKIKAGSYSGVIWMHKEEFDNDNKIEKAELVGTIGIYLDGKISLRGSMEQIGEIGTDSGYAGFFFKEQSNGMITAPIFDDEWASFRMSHQEEYWWLKNTKGFFSKSGYGDGRYPVYVSKNTAGEITAVEIRFL